MKAIIIDDEKAARNVLLNLLQISHPEIEVVDTCENLPEAVMSIRARKPELVFLDVEMPQFAGYEIVKFFTKIDFHIIFVTAYDKYAVKAFELNAIDYLVKPIQRTRLSEAIERVLQRNKDQEKISNYYSVLEQLEEESSPSFSFSESGNQHIIKTANIVAIQAQGAYCQIFMKDGIKHTLSKNIGTLEKELNFDSLLFRTHKSWIVNLREIKSIQKPKETITLTDGQQAKFSRFRKDEFYTLLEEFNALPKV
ncbi:MAG: LytR/AlgR family response regulator transcription factor [Fluviicola sp.]